MKALNADELLQKIFYYMELLFEEKDFSKAIGILTDLGRTLVHSDRASFWVCDEKNGQYWTLAALDNEKIVIEKGSGIVGVAMEANETILINDPYNDSRFNATVDKETGYVTKSILCMPVTNEQGKVIGAYQAINKLDEEGNATGFMPADVKRISMATVFCGKMLESYLLHTEAIIDPLTGLKNRRGFYEYYTTCTIPVESEKDYSMIICDIDHFKKVNDTYGHNGGDAVLQFVSQMFLQSVDKEDDVFRWGGEEFILILSGKDKEKAVGFAENLRKQIEGAVCEFEGQSIAITMSFGVEQIKKDVSSDTMVGIVDEKLYEAKTTGRNKVIG